MDLPSVGNLEPGTQLHLLVRVVKKAGSLYMGQEMHTGCMIAFRHEGVVTEEVMTIYNATISPVFVDSARLITLDPRFPPVGNRPPKVDDFRFVHDALCGLGGFSSACSFLGLQTVSAFDCSKLAVQAFQLNHSNPSWCDTVESVYTLHRMHTLQWEVGHQPMIAGGFPCQPLSKQGRQLRNHDTRSLTLPALLRAGYWMQAAGLLLECVPEAYHDEYTQKCIQEYAQLTGFKVIQGILHLHTVWPARRTRWYALIIPAHIELESLPMMPSLQSPPTVKDIISSPTWPLWDQNDELQLQWTDLEKQVFRDGRFGSTDRRVKMDQPLPTALHSWGNPVTACPCSCRKQGLSMRTLLSKGLRGIEIITPVWPYNSRHIHPRELQVFMGFEPLQKLLPDCRAQLCLFGNAVSPIQVVWLMTHLLRALELITVTPHEMLARYVEQIMHQRDITWPFPTQDFGKLTLKTETSSVEITFHCTQTVGHLLRAEASLLTVHGPLGLSCEGQLLPDTAYLQEREYQLIEKDAYVTPHALVPIILCHLGEMRLHWSLDCMTVNAFVKWVGVTDYVELRSDTGEVLDPQSTVTPWMQVVVLSCTESLDFEFALREEGFGVKHTEFIGQLECTQPHIATGLWKFDEAIKARLLLTWTAVGFGTATVWLPSFAVAVVETWPHVMDEQLRLWLSPDTIVLHAIVREEWGWNLIRFCKHTHSLQIDMFIPPGMHGHLSELLASRAFQASGCRARQVEREMQQGPECPGTLASVLFQFEVNLGIPPSIAAALAEVSPVHLDEQQDGSSFPPTWDMHTSPQQMPMLGSPDPTKRGLSAQFVRAFVQALQKDEAHSTMVITNAIDTQIPLCRVPCHRVKPLVLLVLTQKHWTTVTCTAVDSTLSMVVYDGLAQTNLQAYAFIARTLKRVWNLQTVSISATWKVQQTRANTCGTIALAHHGLLTGKISLEQASMLELLHDGFAACSLTMTDSHLVGYGIDEEAITASLKQILPAKGVPESEVPARATAAIKAFGVKAIQQALAAKNTWAALKQLGSSRPKPFLWVSHAELQAHIKERAQTQFGANADIKKGRKDKQSRQVTPAITQLDPANLQLPAGVFVTNDGTVLPQLSLEQVVKNARGVAFATPSDIRQFIQDGKFISAEALTLLVIGQIPASMPQTLPMHQLRVPAIYRATGDPVILDCTTVQLGDLAVYQKTNQQAPEVQVFPTAVLRAHIFRDLWTQEGDWNDVVQHPIKSLVQAFDLLQLCREEGCTDCSKYHPCIEETGIESGLVDVWGFLWRSHDGNKTTPTKADVLSIYLRVPESSFNELHLSSGARGTFFEPRNKDTPGVDPAFAVIWIPKASLSDALHRVKTLDNCLAVCRLGLKYGIRCHSRHQEDLHAVLCPAKPYVQCTVKTIHRLEPLPAGTQRQSLADILKEFGWVAKPLQQCPGSQGRAWLVGSDRDPPQQFIEAQHGWVSVAKVKEQQAQVKPQDLIATARTKQHIRGNAPAKAQASTDPWQAGSDPWQGYTPTTKAAAPVPSMHVQKKFEDVEQRLEDRVTTSLDAKLKDFACAGKATQEQSEARMFAVEAQIQSLAENQSKLETWIQDGAHKVQELRTDCSQMHQIVQQCTAQVGDQGKAIQSLASDVGQCAQNVQQQGASLNKVVTEVANIQTGLKDTLEDYFKKQAEQIEDILSKRARHT
eukprot:Skav225760  [mRNA]  locus=scaffold3552:72471:77522:+ [translate_table: standard]